MIDDARLHATLWSRESVRQFYAARDNRAFWVSPPMADSLVDFIRHVDHIGLNPSDYHLEQLSSILRDSINVDRYALADPLLTDAWLTLRTHLRKGRLDPKTLQLRDVASTIDQEAIDVLHEADPGSVLVRLREGEPSTAEYRELRKQLSSFVLLAGRDSVQRAQAQKLLLNLERWRWQKPLPDRYLSVNIPAFALRAVEDDSVWLETRVIVGKRETPTPVLESVIRSFIIYPYWHVPNSISTKEILPHLQKEAAYLQRNNFDVLDRDGQPILSDTIQWDYYSADYFPFILRQREGAENSMGIIKFIFANNYGVYLHDTNSKRLFQRTRRDLSHGCVRVSNAVALAHYLIRDDDIYVSPEDLDQYLTLQQRLKIDLRKPIPLRLEYFTAEVRGGVAMFYEDIYKKDSVMMRSLYPSPLPQ